MSSCGTSNIPQRFADYSPEEYNLQSLDRITDNEDNQYGHPKGGDQGRDLFFDVRDTRGYCNIYHMSNPTARAISPKTNGNNINLMPSYCAKTNMIAFSGRQEGSSVADIYMTNAADGVAIRRITNTPNDVEWFPCLSADGNTIVYERVYAQGMLKDAQIWKQDLRSEQSSLLCSGRMPSLSHDGKYITFVQFTADGKSARLMVMEVNGKNQTELTDAKMGLAECPCFSPDDKQIVFQCMKADKQDRDLWVINRDGTGLTQLTFNKSFDGEPYWATEANGDGYIYFSSDRGHNQNSYQIWRFKYGKFGGDRPGPVPGPDEYHVVKQGETISKIANQYGVTVKDLVQWNNLKTMTVSPGMRLRVR